MEPALIVLGRFQPFHKGHAAMIEGAISFLGVENSDLTLRICIGSSQAEQSLDNPWTILMQSLFMHMYIHTCYVARTHTHTYIYIYIYVCVCAHNYPSTT